MFEMPKNPREWTQFLTTRAIAAGWTIILRHIIENHTDWDEDSMTVRASTYVAGELVASAVQSDTDAVVDWAWIRVDTWRVKRQNRKNKAKKK
jgi:hypothetical protein